MFTRTIAVAALGLALVAGGVLAQGALKSGPQKGENVPGPFHPLNINGANAGKKHCLFCENGGNPVAVVFAREVDANITTLIKKLDDATAKNKEAMMGSYVVFCSDEKGLDRKLEELAKKEQLKNIVLSIDNPAGPEDYKIAKDASVTVLLYSSFKVEANHAFKKGDLKTPQVEQIVKDVAKIVK
jgi:hypothetical protein